MPWNDVDEEASAPAKHLVEGIEAGLDDIKSNRGVLGQRVLQKLDRLIANMDDRK